MSKKFFSVVIPTLNEEQSLPKLLGDLRNQTFKDFEVIVVDAKSKDNTQKIARKFSAKVVVSGKKNVCQQRNLGAKKSNSEWILFSDADNRIPKNYLKSLQLYLSKNDPDFLSTWLKPDSKLRRDKIIATIINLLTDLGKKSPRPVVQESMLLARKKSFDSLKGFDVEVLWGEGPDLLKRAYKKGMRFEFIKTPVYTFSFRRLRSLGIYKTLQGLSQMELLKIINGKVPTSKVKTLYPMKGGGFYKRD